MLWWILATLFTIFVYTYLIKPHQHWKKLKVPYIKPWIFFGNTASMVFRQKPMALCIQDMYNAFDGRNRYVGFYTFLSPTLMIRDPNLIKQLGIKEFDHFSDHRSFIPEDIEPLFGKNLFSLTGQKWKNMRSTLSPAFTGSKMRAMFVLISECADQFVGHFSKQMDPTKPLTVEMKDVFSRFATDVIATTAFGIKCDSLNDKNNEFYLMGKDASTFDGFRGLKFFGYSISATLMKALKVKLFSDEVSDFFRNIIVTTMKTREEQDIIRPDMIHLLMEARKGKLRHEDDSKKSDNDVGFATVEESLIGKDLKQALTELSDDDVTAQALLFFIAGFDSISITISHMAYELAINEDVQIKLQKEIDAAMQECSGKVTYDALLKMEYMDMVISETLRKWPVAVSIDRVCIDSYTIPAELPGEHPLKMVKNDIIWFPIYAIHRDPKYFPNPDKFDPERFNDENKGSILPQTYIPFGVGPRNCIGSRFALLEAKTIFFHLLAKFNLVLVEKSQVPLQISKTVFNLNAENGFWLGLKLRN